MNSILDLISRKSELFEADIKKNEKKIKKIVSNSSFLVLGGAGSIGAAVVKEIFKRNPKKLHVVDINENNLTELVRDIRSQLGYISGKFKSLALDIGSLEYDVFIKSDGKYDYVLNLSALKHVRSEKDPFTLMRMINVNILNTNKTIKHSIKNKTKKYFCVSTDKATNPVNLMGASKRIMELYLITRSSKINVSTARFANVAFSDGSLLHGFDNRLKKRQPIAAPSDVRRYFLTPKESGELCLLSCIFGKNRDIFFPKINIEKNLLSFSELAIKYLHLKGYEAYLCESEGEARELIKTLPDKKKWPCLFTKSNTTGEKEIEEFFTKNEKINMKQFVNLGVIKNDPKNHIKKLKDFERTINKLKLDMMWNKQEIIHEFNKLIPNFHYIDKKRYLDEKM
jgi:FlaA1/EpsC-like NDP-sugar epimerase